VPDLINRYPEKQKAGTLSSTGSIETGNAVLHITAVLLMLWKAPKAI
jgi:hypothetical protein